MVGSESECRELLATLQECSGPVGLDTETVDVNLDKQGPVGNGRIICWSVAWLAGGVIERRLIPNWDPAHAGYLRILAPWLESAAHPKVGANVLGFDKHIFANHGIVLRGVTSDVVRKSRLAYSSKEVKHDLKSLMRRYLGWAAVDYDTLFTRPKRNKPKVYKRTQVRKGVLYIEGEVGTFSWTQREFIPLTEVVRDYPQRLEQLIEYATLDAAGPVALEPFLDEQLRKLPARQGTNLDLYQRTWHPFCELLTELEQRGVTLDSQACREGELRARADVERYDQEVKSYEGVPADINLGSSDQLRELLYRTWGLPRSPICGTLKAIKATDPDEYSTAEAAIYWLQLNAPDELKPALNTIRLRKKARRLYGYLRDLPGFVGRDGRVHTMLGPDTDTGRLASRKPALQQIPSDDPYGVRRAFVPGMGKLLVVADYSQLEVYVLAHMLIKLFGDRSVAEALATGDVYGAVAKQCWPTALQGIDASAIKHHPDKEIQYYRKLAKVVVLATNYGKTPQGLAISLLDETGKSAGLDYALEILGAYFAAFPGVRKYQEWARDYALKYGGIPTLLGRWRPITNRKARGARQAANTPIQGSAADIMTVGMLMIEEHRLLRDVYGYRQLLQIHDEVLGEAPAVWAEEAAEDVERCMLRAGEQLELELPLKVDVKVAPCWAEGK